MATTICENCETENDKIRDTCKECGNELYREVSPAIAKPVILVLDACFLILNILAIPSFITMVREQYQMVERSGQYSLSQYEPMLAALPEMGSVFFYGVIALFIIAALVRLLFLANVFTLKLDILYKIRKLWMYPEMLTLFHLVLAMYFYRPAIEAYRTDTSNKA